MYDIVDYVNYNAAIPMELCDVSPEDALALALVAAINWPNAGSSKLSEAWAAYSTQPGAQLSGRLYELMEAMAKSARYGDLIIDDFSSLYSAEPALQFSAATISDGSNAFIAFRGTDDSIAGWLENMETAYLEPIPAQTEALRYISRAAEKYSGCISVGGHSKGGGLALYSAAASGTTQSRIERIFSFDGPGLAHRLFSSEDYENIRAKLLTLVPPQSIVGMLLWQNGELRIVKSSASGVAQHDPFTWLTTPQSFEYAPALSAESMYLRDIARALALSLPPVALKRLIDSLYGLVLDTDARTFRDLSAYFSSHPKKLMQAQGDVDGRAMYILLYLIAAIAAA